MAKSARARAWRNLMVAAINAALEQKLLTLDPPQNLWPGADASPRERSDPYVFGFDFNGAPALASLFDIGWDEVSVHACYLPKPDGARWVPYFNAGFLAGEAFACGWLERKTGRYLQDGEDQFRCRRWLIPTLSQINVEPMGYVDHGRVIF